MPIQQDVSGIVKLAIAGRDTSLVGDVPYRGNRWAHQTITGSNAVIGVQKEPQAVIIGPVTIRIDSDNDPQTYINWAENGECFNVQITFANDQTATVPNCYITGDVDVSSMDRQMTFTLESLEAMQHSPFNG